MEIGSKGLCEANLTIPQETSLSFTVVHKDSAGNVIDHSGSVVNMAFQSKDKTRTYDLDSCCTTSAEGIYVTIPPEISESMPIGKMNWDMIITAESGEQFRILYGNVTIVDTYALDEV